MKRLLLILALLGIPIMALAQTRTLVTFMGTYSSSQPYNINDMVSYSGITYVSLVSSNLNNTPSSSPSDWSIIGVESGAGTGTVTSFSSGSLSPLFTTSVATATSTPALSFTLTSAGADTVLGNPTGSSAAPSYTASPVLTALTAATITDSGLTSGQCVQASTGGLLTTTGSACGSGGGGGTTTNALTMNNSGSGASSGSTFNGSAAETISYNTIGAQQALTLTTTGTSGAATLSSGTLNIPQYSGGGSSAWSGITAGANTATGAFSTTAPWTYSYAGTASTAAMLISGAPYASGTDITNVPQLYLNSGGTAPSTWSTHGTTFGVNAPSGFTGNFSDFHVNGGASVFSVGYTGAATALSLTTSGTANGSLTMLYTGTAAATPTTNQVQISPAVSITTPYTISPPGSGSTGLLYGTYTSGTPNVEQLSYTTTPTVTSLTDSGLTSGQCVQTSTGGLLATTGSACGSGGSSSWPSITGGGTNAVTSQFITEAPWEWTANDAASTPVIYLTGTPYTGGTSTTDFPLLLLQPSGATAVTTWSTNGTVFGMNEASGFIGNYLDIRGNGGSSQFYVSSGGSVGVNHLNQTAGNDLAGTCTFNSSPYTSCVVTLSAAFASTPVCIATIQGTVPGNTVACTVSGTTLTLTLNAGNDGVVAGYAVFGNPN
jgi:hypothetical protein